VLHGRSRVYESSTRYLGFNHSDGKLVRLAYLHGCMRCLQRRQYIARDAFEHRILLGVGRPHEVYKARKPTSSANPAKAGVSGDLIIVTLCPGPGDHDLAVAMVATRWAYSPGIRRPRGCKRYRRGRMLRWPRLRDAFLAGAPERYDDTFRRNSSDRIAASSAWRLGNSVNPCAPPG
jgi:hypothetical protein